MRNTQKLFSHTILDKYNMFEGISANYPREFFYQISKLQGSMSKQVIKVTADRATAIAPSNIVNYRLPIGALLNLDSLNLYFKVDMKVEKVLPARYASTFIKRLSLQINNVSVQIIQDYNFIYNIYNDHNNKAYSKGIGGDWVDNSILWTHTPPTTATESSIDGANAFLAANGIQTGMKFCINNFIGLLGSASTKILPTDRCGEVVVSIEFAPAADVLGGVESVTPTASATYEITDTFLTCEALSFSDDTYYNSIGDKDLKIGFNDYVYTSFAESTKKTGINVTTYISAGSIDHICATARRPQVTIPDKMIATKVIGGAGTTAMNLANYLSDPVAAEGDGDGFYSTVNMQRNLAHMTSSQFSINNKALNWGAFDQTEAFQNNLLALGYENVDISANGLNPSIVSLFHYYKYYAAIFQSLELIDKDGFYISGLSSSGSSCAINWVCKFDGATNVVKIIPVIIAKLSRILHIKSGRIISVE
jgi:hypothetical protein